MPYGSYLVLVFMFKDNPTQTSQRGNPRKNNPIGYNMGNGQPTTISSSHQTLNEQQKININNYNNNNNNNNNSMSAAGMSSLSILAILFK